MLAILSHYCSILFIIAGKLSLQCRSGRQAGLKRCDDGLTFHTDRQAPESQQHQQALCTHLSDCNHGHWKFVESCLCLVTGWRPLLHDCCSRGPLRGPASSQPGVIWSLSACSLPLRLPTAHPDYKEWLSAGCYLWAAAEKQYCNLILHE